MMSSELIDKGIQFVALAIGAWLAHAVKTPRGHERAERLARIAQDAAALVVMEYPDASWAQLLEKVMEETRHRGQTNDDRVLRRVAAGALVGIPGARARAPGVTWPSPKDPPVTR